MTAFVALGSAVAAGVFAVVLISGATIAESSPGSAPSVAEVVAHLDGGSADAAVVRARLGGVSGPGLVVGAGCAVLR